MGMPSNFCGKKKHLLLKALVMLSSEERIDIDKDQFRSATGSDRLSKFIKKLIFLRLKLLLYFKISYKHTYICIHIVVSPRNSYFLS